jgi:hypothetical protein
MIPVIRTAILAAALLSMLPVPTYQAASASQAPSTGSAPADAGWTTFEGTWLAQGNRKVVPTETGFATSLHVSGAIKFMQSALSRTFAADAAAFDDGRERVTGRVVWTDDRRDRIYSELQGGPLGLNPRVRASITGGTGAYAGMTGEYEISWEFFSRGSTGPIDAREVSVKGRFRRTGRP